MTPAEYGILRDAWELQRLDEDYQAAQFAWMNARARDRRRSGNATVLVHTEFREFFDREKHENDILRRQRVRSGREEAGDSRLKRLSQHLARKTKEKAEEGGGSLV